MIIVLEAVMVISIAVDEVYTAVIGILEGMMKAAEAVIGTLEGMMRVAEAVIVVLDAVLENLHMVDCKRKVAV